MVCDLHTHSCYSFDGRDGMEDICHSAAARLVDIVAVTDHCDMTSEPEGIADYLSGETERLREYECLRQKLQDVELLYGIEMGNTVDMPGETARFLEKREFDFVIGAIHFLSDGTDIYKMPFPDRGSIDRMFRDYFPLVLRQVELGGFDSLAHLDYPLRVLQGKIDSSTVSPYRELIDPILVALVRKDIALEINTRGSYDWQHRVGPEDWVLRRYRELGGRLVTIGSDAHAAALVGEGFAQAAEALRRSGFDAYTVYRNRKPFFISI